MSGDSKRYARGAENRAAVASAALAALASMLLLAPQARAAAVSERSESAIVPAGEHVEYSVGCRGKSRTSGVGFLSEPGAEAGIGITSALAPTGKTNVVVRGSEVGAGGSDVSHTAYAYCIRKLRQTVRIRTEPTVTEGIAVAIADCPGRKRAIGGGFFAPPFGGGNGELAGIVVSSHRETRSSWRVEYFNADSDDNSEFTAYAICAKLKVKEARETATADVGGGGGAGDAAKARCPRRHVALSGGFAAVEEPGANDGNLAIPFSSRRTGKRAWRTTALPNQATPERFRSFVYCMKKGG